MTRENKKDIPKLYEDLKTDTGISISVDNEKLQINLKIIGHIISQI